MNITALILQGGGALGAYQYGVIAGLHEKFPNFTPEIITGVSIGAINGAVMLGGKWGAVKSLEKLWKSLQTTQWNFLPKEWQSRSARFGNTNLCFMNPALLHSPFTANSLYNISPLQKLLTEIIDFEQLNTHSSTLVVETINVETGQLERFSNKDAEGLTIEKLIASVSIPPDFPAVEIDHSYYWDGSLHASMPLGAAINHLEQVQLMNGQPITEREMIIISLLRKQAKMPSNFLEIMERIKEIIFAGKLNLDRKLFDKMNNYIDLIQEIDRYLAEDHPIRQHKGFQRLLNHQKINPPIVLQYEAEGLAGADDFTTEAIDFRYRKGYSDALRTFRKKQAMAIPNT